jgi:hypothetical protein
MDLFYILQRVSLVYLRVQVLRVKDLSTLYGQSLDVTPFYLLFE